MTTMKKTIVILLLLPFLSYPLFAQVDSSETLEYHLSNLAVSMDGNDNEIKTGIRVIEGAWTLETWIKGDDTNWKDIEVIIGGGEYSTFDFCDNLPLVLKKGKLYCRGANIESKIVLDDSWHHVAASSNGHKTSLYLDGELVAWADTAMAILPGAIGSNEKGQTFGGLIDEVRVWNSCLSQETLNQWKGKSLAAKHPHFDDLIAYYPFDDFKDELSINWAAKGLQSYHARNGRLDFYGSAPMSYAVKNNNTLFETYNGTQNIFDATVINSEWDVDRGANDCQILKLRIAVNGNEKPLQLTSLELNLSQNTSLSDISKVHLYRTGKYPSSENKIEICGTGIYPENKLTFTIDSTDNTYLSQGINYFLVTFDIKDNAAVNNTIHASLSSFKLDGVEHTAKYDNDFVKQKVTQNSSENLNILKVLQWNIWHGGVHLGKHQGRKRIIDLIQATNADIVTMQEGYGAQDSIASSIGFNLITKSSKDNLALLSRYPMSQIVPTESFKSNPAVVSLPNDRRILVNACWLRYAYRPEYTCIYPNGGLDTNLWVVEDSILALVDAKKMMENDIKPNKEYKGMPIIFGGGFNTGSHLDWTERAKHLHNDYGLVNFPVSRYFIEEGYKDSFREMNPDEVAYQGGTFAVIFGQLQNSRIDYIYYTGDDIEAISSKIIRTSQEIDDVWASDHAAVLTIFDTSKK